MKNLCRANVNENRGYNEIHPLIVEFVVVADTYGEAEEKVLNHLASVFSDTERQNFYISKITQDTGTFIDD